MPGVLQILVYERQQKVYSDSFDSGSVELGRQRDSKEPLFVAQRQPGRARVAIAQLNEDTVSREHALIEPLPDGRIRISNRSAKVSIRLADGGDLRAGASAELNLPAVITLGNKTVRIQREESGSGLLLHSLKEAPPAPGTVALGGSGRFAAMTLSGALSRNAVRNEQVEEILRWLQTIMEVLQAAASSSDFFRYAAQAIVEVVGLDRGCVLLLQDGEWRPQFTHTASHVNPNAPWSPSQQILTMVHQEKRTFWQSPDDVSMDETPSLAGVETVVASPILNPQGEVIGVIYGDCRHESQLPASPEVSRIEAMLVELLARGVAVGLARMEQEQAAVAARVQFEQFFTPELSRQLALQPNLLEGRDCEVTLLFCDVRGFSRISERLGPAGTVAWVSHVMSTLSDCVLKHRGVLVDYIGDELLAMWGAPEEQPDHARLACLAALDMMATLPRLNERWQAILGEQLHIGVGLNTGVARVGNTGSRHKFKYGPLGNSVNLASRVQGATKYLKCPLLITEYTQRQLDDSFNVRKLCAARVVNINQPVHLFELVPPGHPHWPDLKIKYEHALEEFNQGHFRPTARILANLLADVPDDGPSLVLMARAVNALVDGTPERHPVWDLPGK